jgi:Domain of unknown function (DUF4136)
MNTQRPPIFARLFLSTAALMLTLAACSTLQVGSDYDHSATFSAFHTFSFMQRDHSKGVHNPLVAQRIQDAIKADLTSRGYVYTDNAADADFLVDFTVGAKERTDIQTYPQPYSGWYGYGGPGWWGGPYWGSGVNVQQYTEGTLSIDFFDAHTHRPVWHGWAKKPVSDTELSNGGKGLQEAVGSVLMKFPPTAAT